jgi:hypothetical protein
VRIHDPLDDGKSEPCATLLGGEKRFSEARQLLWRDGRPVVSDFNVADAFSVFQMYSN